MKKLLIAIIATLTISTVVVYTGEISQSDLSQGLSPFRPTAAEMNGGIEYKGEGVYLFTLTGGDFNATKRDFGTMLAAFRKNHPKLEQEAMAPAKMDELSGGVIRISSYYVTFHEK